MKKLHKLAAAVAVAAGIALSPQSQAIELKPNGVGDALLFPAFNGYIENYFTVSNQSDKWIQSHMRFRGAAWSAELRDFDVILSPGDVFVFRVADLDGDGLWEIDESLDQKNFQYTGMIHECSTSSGTAVPLCLDASNLLEPDLDDKKGITQALIDHQRHVGYVEFIGEAVLNGMTDAIMSALIGNVPGVWAPYVTENGNKHGTSAWKWSNAPTFSQCTGNNHPCNMGLLDVGNWLSGTAFVTVPGQTHGLAYNAEAFVDFRSADFKHRIDNYVGDGDITLYTGSTGVNPTAVGTQINNIVAGEQTAVILHHESANSPATGPSPQGDYVYGCAGNEPYEDELVISFNNTWGPTLADGNDTNGITADRWETVQRRGSAIYIQNSLPTINTPDRNSIAEVEDAIAAMGQVYYSYYFHNMPFDASTSGNKATLQSYFFGYFPTKFYYGENPVNAAGKTCKEYINLAVEQLLKMAKPLAVEVWDTTERNCTRSSSDISPARPDVVSKVLGHELNIFNVDWLKTGFNNPSCSGFKSGRAVIQLLDTIANNDDYPGLLYTFEIGSDSALSHWRAMQR